MEPIVIYVYIVLGHFDYEGSTPLGVFFLLDGPDGARTFAETVTGYDSVSIERSPVGKAHAFENVAEWEIV